MRFIPNNGPVRDAMLAEAGFSAIEDLFASIPPEARLTEPLRIPPGMAEQDQLEFFRALAAGNGGDGCSVFLGAGSYPHFIPLTADSLLQRGEFLTAYTPYQPEVSQGTLQAVFEFQTFMCILTGMEAANASVYDGASATAEAVLMSVRLQRNRKRVILPASLHPFYRQVVETYTANLELELETVPFDPLTGRMDMRALENLLGEDVACVVAQQPNFLGVVEDMEVVSAAARRSGAQTVAIVTEALSLALLKPPGECGADIVAGEAQSFGVPVYYGGPYLGFMATRNAHRRQLPGRIAGQTVDAEGRRGFVLTLATREQHIRREKATSNICTNENLVMLSALMYLTLMGREGLKAAAGQNVSLMAYFLRELERLPGYGIRYSGPRFNEVAISCPRPAAEVLAACLGAGVLPGLDLGRFLPGEERTLLLALTETKTRAEVDALLKALSKASGEAA